MTKLIAILLALTCATLHAQTVILQADGSSVVRGVGANVKGTATPIAYTNFSSGRFTVWNTNQNVVIDNDSGLTWTRDTNIDGQKDWTNAGTYCDELTYATYSDWRVPSITELSRDDTYGATNGLVYDEDLGVPSALPPGHPFTNIISDDYWSSTDEGAGETDEAYSVLLPTGPVELIFKTYSVSVWPCRGP